MLILAVNMNYVGYATTRSASQAAPANNSIIEFFTGKYLCLQLCKVLWEWQDPQVVGKTVSFKVSVSIVFFLHSVQYVCNAHFFEALSLYISYYCYDSNL